MEVEDVPQSVATENVENEVKIEADEEMDAEEIAEVKLAESNVRRREDFTSEIYKIEISNMGNFGYGVSVFFSIRNK